MSTSIVLVGFHGEQISTCKDEQTGKVYCMPKELTAFFGLNWGGQQQKLTKSLLYNKHLRYIDIYTPGGRQEVIMLDIDYLPTWLSSISPERVHASVRDKLLRYQEECAQALRDYWTKGFAQNPRQESAHDAKVEQWIGDLANLMGVGYQKLSAHQVETDKAVQHIAERQAQMEHELTALRLSSPLAPEGWHTTLDWLETSGTRKDVGWIPQQMLDVFKSWCRAMHPRAPKYRVPGREYPIEHWPLAVLVEAWERTNKQISLFDYKKHHRPRP